MCKGRLFYTHKLILQTVIGYLSVVPHHVSFECVTRFLVSSPQQYTDMVSNQCGLQCLFFKVAFNARHYTDMVSVLCEYYVSFERATRFLLSRPQQYTDIVSNQCGSWCVFQGCLQCMTIHPGNTLICYLSCVNIMCFQCCHQRTSIHTDGGSHLFGLEFRTNLQDVFSILRTRQNLEHPPLTRVRIRSTPSKLFARPVLTIFAISRKRFCLQSNHFYLWIGN